MKKEASPPFGGLQPGSRPRDIVTDCTRKHNSVKELRIQRQSRSVMNPYEDPHW